MSQYIAIACVVAAGLIFLYVADRLIEGELVRRRRARRECGFVWCRYRYMNCSAHLSRFNRLERFWKGRGKNVSPNNLLVNSDLRGLNFEVEKKEP